MRKDNTQKKYAKQKIMDTILNIAGWLLTFLQAIITVVLAIRGISTTAFQRTTDVIVKANDLAKNTSKTTMNARKTVAAKKKYNLILSIIIGIITAAASPLIASIPAINTLSLGAQIGIQMGILLIMGSIVFSVLSSKEANNTTKKLNSKGMTDTTSIIITLLGSVSIVNSLFGFDLPGMAGIDAAVLITTVLLLGVSIITGMQPNNNEQKNAQKNPLKLTNHKTSLGITYAVLVTCMVIPMLNIQTGLLSNSAFITTLQVSFAILLVGFSFTLTLSSADKYGSLETVISSIAAPFKTVVNSLKNFYNEKKNELALPAGLGKPRRSTPINRLGSFLYQSLETVISSIASIFKALGSFLYRSLKTVIRSIASIFKNEGVSNQSSLQGPLLSREMQGPAQDSELGQDPAPAQGPAQDSELGQGPAQDPEQVQGTGTAQETGPQMQSR